MDPSSRKSEFRRLFQKVESDLYRYLLVMVAREADALDLLQETAGALWAQFEHYDASRPFAPWAHKFAYMEVLRFRLYRAREGEKRVQLSEESLHALSADYDAHQGVFELRKAALALCVDKLPAAEQQLVEQRYWQRKKIREMAHEQGLHEDRLSRRMQRIRNWLQTCIERTLAEQGG